MNQLLSSFFGNGLVPVRSSRIVGSGEMAELIRTFDWEDTGLGGIEGWPGELVAAVNMMLASPVVTTVLWGPEMVMLYNDAYRPHLADKHPALGKAWRVVWPEVLEDVGTLLAEVYTTGEALDITRMPMELELNGVMVEKQYGLTIVPMWAEREHGLEIAGLYQTANDCTDAMLAKRERDAANERLKQVLEDTNDSVMTIDRGWTVTYMNRRAAEVTAPIDPVGKNLWETYPAFIYEGSPWVANYHRAMEERVGCVFEGFYGDPIHVWVEIQVQPSKEGITLFFTDITERKVRERWERKLAEDRERFFSLVEGTHSFVAMCDMEGKPCYANPATHALLGFESLEDCKETIRTIFFCEDQEFVFDEFMGRVRRLGHAEVEIRFRHFVTGEAIWVSLLSFLMRDANEQVTRYALIGRRVKQDALERRGAMLEN